MIKQLSFFSSVDNDTAATDKPGISPLPKGWGLLTLGEILSDIRGGTWGDDDDPNGTGVFRPNNIGFDGQVVYENLRYRSIPVNQLEKQCLSTGDVILTKSNSLEQIGRCAYFVQPNDGRNYVASNFLQKLSFHRNRVVPEYAFRFLTTRISRDYFQKKAKGTSASLKNISTEDIRSLEIPVPFPDDLNKSLFEQRRIVERIDAFVHRVDETLKRMNCLEQEFDALCRSFIFDLSGRGFTPIPMNQLVKLRTPDVVVKPDEVYAFAGLKSFGRGVFKGPVKSGAEFAYPRLTRLHAGEFVYPKLMAWEGAFGVVPRECDGLVVSTEFPVFEVIQEKVLPETLDVYFRTPAVWPVISEISTGTNARRKRLHPSAFLAYEMPLPPMKTQLRLREMKQRVDELRQRHTLQRKDLELLLPAVLDRAFRGEL